MSAVVHASCGTIRGIPREGSFAFLGIPYAEAPVGTLRFQAPRRRPAFTEEFAAFEHGATPQRRKFYDETFIPEPSIPGDDILNLNVFTPSVDANSNLPVLVYIHGGGYMSGSHVGEWFDGVSFNRDDIVVVVIGYRLGFEGFGWIQDAPSNRGMSDMVCALEWVRENISAFGGNPSQVTICGQSAGGGAVLALAAMPSAQGLFRSVISQSPVIGAATADQHEDRGRAFAQACGVKPSLAGWNQLTDIEILDKQFPLLGFAEPIHAAAGMVRWIDGAPCECVLPWGPVIDGKSIPLPPYDALRESDVSLLIGSTVDEFIIPGESNAEAIRIWAQDVRLSASHRSYLENAINGQLVDPIGRLATAAFFREGVVKVGLMDRPGPSWIYDFVHLGEGTAGHCTDLPFIWDVLDYPHTKQVFGSDQPQSLADEMHGVWSRFIRTGEADWPAGQCLVFGQREDWRGYQDIESLVAALPPSS